MKIESLTFTCDAPKCREKHTSPMWDGSEVGAYLELAESGWKVDRAWNGWKHYCPEHVEREVTA